MMTSLTPATLAHDRTGRGSPLVLLHPLGADRHVWDPVLPLLTSRREVVVLDLPGFGESPPLAAEVPTPRALAAAVAAHLAEIGVRRPHVAGNSLGGWVALELGLSGVAASVTGIAPAGLWPEPLVPKAAMAHRLARSLLPAATWSVGTRAGRSVLLASAMAFPRRMPAAAARQLVRAYALAPDFVRVNDAMRARRFEGLERIRCPVTLVWPDHDRLIRRPVWVPDRIRNVVLSDAGHMPMWDAPEALAATLVGATGGEAADAADPPSLAQQLAGEAS
jgi:pimeloyl-ACP methyl ester carboxylesterase